MYKQILTYFGLSGEYVAVESLTHQRQHLKVHK
jgi:hypothetical protein